jgi:hypothetical protein
MSLPSIVLLGFVFALLLFDAVTLRRRARRMLAMEAVVFAVGGFFIATPDAATRLANLVGIGRGVDFVLYPAVIWLVRESLLSRQRHLEESRRFTQVVRDLAIASAVHSARPSGSLSAACGPHPGQAGAVMRAD